MKKYIWITIAVVVVAIIGYLIFGRKKAPAYTVAYTVANQDVRTTVLATGTVTSQSNLSLGFQNAGTVAAVNVVVNQSVKQGQVLASLDAGAAQAAISQAQAQVDSAQASLEKIQNGSSATSIAVSQAAVDSAKVALANAQANYSSVVAQQAVAVANAHSALLSSGLQATPSGTNVSTATIAVSGTYTGSTQGSYTFTVQTTGNGPVYSVSGLEQQAATTLISRGTPQALGTMGLFITFSAAGTLSAGDSWTVSIPNMLSSTYVANSNAYQAALQTQANQTTTAQSQVSSAQASLEQAQASLANTSAPSLPQDVDAAKAAVAQAEAALQSAQVQYSNDIIVAPINGTVTAVNAKIGQTASPSEDAIEILDPSSLHVESDISESSIAQVQPGQPIAMTLNAFGPNQNFAGTVTSIDPASTVIQGVIDYRVVSSLPANPDIKPGMTVNLVITTNDVPNVLAVPSRLISGSGSSQTVSVLKNGTPASVSIATGAVGDTYTQIVSGLSAGDEIVTTK
jgi:RND family efflux transporter MFP subunit